MKKFTILLASLAVMASSVPAFAGKDRIITVGELPAVAQQFVQTHFKAVEVSYAKVDEELFDKDYKVVFVNGSKVEFAKDGAWKEVDCKYGEVPAAIVPQQIRDYVAKNFAGRKIRLSLVGSEMCIRDRLGGEARQRSRPEIRPSVPPDRDRRLIRIPLKTIRRRPNTYSDAVYFVL